jgi:putative chitinase
MGWFDWFKRKPATGKQSLQVQPAPPLFEEPAAPVAPVATVKDKAMSPATPQRRLVTKEMLAAAYQCPMSRADYWDDWINEAAIRWGITDRLDLACWLAQLGHESGRLKYAKEIWGNTRAQRKYEWRKDLGNTKPGDGKRYMGRGPIQITGKFNYRKVTQWIRKVVPDAPDFEANPHLLELPRWGSLAAGAFWKWNNLSDLGKLGAITKTTRVVNGGYNGLADRKAIFQRLLKVL